MLIVSIIWILVIFLLSSSNVYADMTGTKALISNLLYDYDTDVRPIKNQFSAIAVNVTAYIKSIQEFDEVKEKFSFAGALLLTWKDENMVWNPADYGGINKLTVSYKRVWVPELILSSPSEDADTLGKSWNKIRYDYFGRAVWVPMDLIESTCSVDVKSYPFDTQKCVTSFYSIGYDSTDLILVPNRKEFDFTVYQENSLWSITRSEVSAQTTEGSSQIDLMIQLKRKPSFVIINVVLPIFFLSLLNALVFLLVPESGERVSYCVTILLAITVFMTIVSDMLPRSSDPVPIISYKLMVDTIISSLIVVLTVFNLRIYNVDKNTPVPDWLQYVYSCLSRRKCKSTPVFSLKNNEDLNEKSKKIKAVTVTEEKHSTVPVRKSRQLSDSVIREDNITWRHISFMIDWISFVVFTTASVLSFLIFIAITV